MRVTNHKGICHKASRICDRAVHISSIVLSAPCAVALVVWTLIFTVFIIARTFFNANWQFVEEFTQYWLVAIVFLPLLYTLQKKKHITIDIVINRLHGKVRYVVDVISSFLVMAVACYLTFRGAEWFASGFIENKHSNSPSQLLLWPILLLVPIGLAALSAGLLLEFRNAIKKRSNDR